MKRVISLKTQGKDEVCMTLFESFQKEFEHLKTLEDYIELIDEELDRRTYDVSTNHNLTNIHCYSFFNNFTTDEVEQFKIFVSNSKIKQFNKKFKVANDFNPKDPKVFAQVDTSTIKSGIGIDYSKIKRPDTRFLIPCKIDIQKVIQSTLKDQSQIHNDNFNFDSHGYLPIMVNGMPVGYIVNSKESVLWFDIIPEFTMFGDKWELSGLNIKVGD